MVICYIAYTLAWLIATIVVIIKTIEVKGYLAIVTFTDGRRFFFFYNEGSKFIVKFGWKFWKQEIKIGKYYNASYVINH